MTVKYYVYKDGVVYDGPFDSLDKAKDAKAAAKKRHPFARFDVRQVTR